MSEKINEHSSCNLCHSCNKLVAESFQYLDINLVSTDNLELDAPLSAAAARGVPAR